MLSMRKTPANYGWENLLLLFDAVNEAADRHTDAQTTRHADTHIVKKRLSQRKADAHADQHAKNHIAAVIIGLLFPLIRHKSHSLLLLVAAEASDIIHVVAPVCPAQSAAREPVDPLTGGVDPPYGILR